MSDRDRRRVIWSHQDLAFQMHPADVPGYLKVHMLQGHTTVTTLIRVGTFLERVRLAVAPDDTEISTPASWGGSDESVAVAITYDLDRDIHVDVRPDPDNAGHVTLSLVQRQFGRETFSRAQINSVDPDELVQLANDHANIDLWEV
jgi:hypothetical protein